MTQPPTDEMVYRALARLKRRTLAKMVFESGRERDAQRIEAKRERMKHLIERRILAKVTRPRPRPTPEDEGWTLDTHSTFLSRKYSYHKMVGELRYVKIRKTYAKNT